jgi:Zn-dependent protease with chaperone function
MKVTGTWMALVTSLLIGFASPVRAPAAATADPQGSAAGSAAPQAQAPDQSAAVLPAQSPVDLSTPQPATQAPVPVPTPSPEAVRLYRSGNVLWIVSTLWGFLVPAAIWFSGFSARLRDWALRIGKYWYFVVVLYFVFFTLTAFAANVALDYYSDFVRPHAYGLSSQAFAKWLHDELVNLGIGLAAGAMFLWVPYLLLRHATRRWWLYTWLASIPVLLCISFIEPIWIEPLFNHFGPMQDKVLEARILELAHRAGIEGADVFEVDKSVDTNELNAYVTGIGDTKRIVLWDTIIKQSTPDELLLVMGHEMGHYALGHVWRGLILGIAILLLGLWLVHRCAQWILHRYAARTGVAELGDVASLPLLVTLFSVFTFLLTPALLAYSRHLEHEADRFGLEITHDNHDCATAFVKFVQHDLAYPTPGPLYVFWRMSHPPLAERIGFCNSYHPWLDGRAGRYAAYFKPAAAGSGGLQATPQ